MSSAELWLICVFAGVAGLLVGSFLNVVISRVPDGRSVVKPRSACPGCGVPIAARDNIPIISWLILRGKCRGCGEHISVVYPLIELTTGVTWFVLAWWTLLSDEALSSLLPWLLVLASACIALFVIDVRHHRLPDAIVFPLYPLLVLGLVLAGLLSGQWEVVGAAVGAVIWLAVLGGLWLISGGKGMGFGDVKLAPILGATLGWLAWQASLVGLMTAFVLGGVVGVVLILTGQARRGTRIPFGPYLIVGTGVGLVFGGQMWQAYLEFVGSA